jgi:chaperone required for assembly of F1-ATPase
MRRFYAEVEVREAADGWAVTLDGRPVRTPRKRVLAAPGPDLAAAIAEEWRAQGDEVRPDGMPLTRLANAALDLLPERRGDAIDTIAAYAATDLVCYRASEPLGLVERQLATWQPLLDWLHRTHGARLVATTGVVPIAQPRDAVARLREVVAAEDDWTLAGLHAASTAIGSIVIGLALRAGRIDAEQAFRAGLLDELFEIERWGLDEEHRRRHGALRTELRAAARLMEPAGR